MKRNEQLMLGSLAIIGLIAAFWFLVLSPKRNEASQLQNEVGQLQSSLSQAQQEVADGQDAQESFRVDYRRMVVLGKAVPADGDQTSLLVQLQDLADRSGVEFQTIDLNDAGAAAASVPSTSTSTTSPSSTESSSTSSESSSSSTTTTSTSAPASEASVATLPIGAAVGPAGLPVMPYEMSFTGNFFQIADFMQRLDGLVHVQDGVADVHGRLVTVDGFTLTPTDKGSMSEPLLSVDLSVSSFLTPADQGITAGATPSGPATGTPTLASSSTSADPASTPSSTATATESSTTSSATP